MPRLRQCRAESPVLICMNKDRLRLSRLTAAALLIALATGGSLAAASNATVYPAPAGEKLFEDYQVQVEGKTLDVYTARVLDPPFAGKYDFGGNYGFATFDMSGPVIVRIASRRVLKGTVVRPRSLGIEPVVVDDHTITLKLERPVKISIEPDGKKAPLLLFANPPETDAPKEGQPGVVYFGPGVHKPEKIALGSNQTLYLAGGAVVKAEVFVQGQNVTVRGRGVLDGSDWPWRKGPVGSMIRPVNSSDVLIRDIIIRGSPHWTIVPVNCERVTVRNVKLCNSRVQNDDGINPCNSRKVLITDCFIRSDDDCVALKGLTTSNGNVEDITVENCTLWCDRARIFLLGHESRAPFMRNVRLRDLDIVHFSMTAFLLEPGEEMRLEDIRVENVRIHAQGQPSLLRLQPVVNQYMRTKTPGFIRDVRFKDVRLTGRPGEGLLEVRGADEKHDVRDVRFDGVTVGGEKLTAQSKRVRIGPHTSGVEFK